MRVITGRVVEGKIEAEADLPEGTPVAILAEDSGGFRLSSEDEQELFVALQEIRRGNYVDARELLREKSSSWRCGSSKVCHMQANPFHTPESPICAAFSSGAFTTTCTTSFPRRRR